MITGIILLLAVFHHVRERYKGATRSSELEALHTALHLDDEVSALTDGDLSEELSRLWDNAERGSWAEAVLNEAAERLRKRDIQQRWDERSQRRGNS